MTPERRQALLALTPLGHWVAAGFDWDSERHPKDERGRWTRSQAYSPTADYGDGADRPAREVHPEHLPESLRDAAVEWRAGLDGDERGAIEDYTASGFKGVNRALRATGGDPTNAGVGQYAMPWRTVPQTIAGLLSATAKLPPHDPPLTCWRIMSLAPERMTAFVAAAEAAAATGDDFKMPVFGSATLNPAFAQEASANSAAGVGTNTIDPVLGTSTNKQTVLLEIRSRTGLPIGAAGLSSMIAENEVLQSPLAKYRVRGWKDVSFGVHKRRLIQLDELAPEVADNRV